NRLYGTGPVIQVCLEAPGGEWVPWEVSVWLFHDLRHILGKQSPSFVFLLPESCNQKWTGSTPSRPPDPNSTIYRRYCKPTPPRPNWVNKVVGWLAGLRTLPVTPMKTCPGLTSRQFIRY